VIDNFDLLLVCCLDDRFPQKVGLFPNWHALSADELGGEKVPELFDQFEVLILG
jgi:hypothetical protein